MGKIMRKGNSIVVLGYTLGVVMDNSSLMIRWLYFHVTRTNVPSLIPVLISWSDQRTEYSCA